MRVEFRRHNNKGQLSARPWVVVTAFGAYVSSFETQEAADFFVENRGIAA